MNNTASNIKGYGELNTLHEIEILSDIFSAFYAS